MRTIFLSVALCSLALLSWFAASRGSADDERPPLPTPYQPFANNDKARLTQVWGTPERYVGVAERIAYAPDGKSALVANTDPSDADAADVLTHFDLSTRKIRQSMTIPKTFVMVPPTNQANTKGIIQRPWVSALAIAPDCKHACSATFADNGGKAFSVLLYWDLTRAKLIHEIKGINERIVALAFSPDGSKVIGASWDGAAYIWDLKAGNLLHSLPGPPPGVAMSPGVAISPDGTKALTTGNGLAKLWDLKTGRITKTMETKVGSSFAGVAFLPDGNHFMAIDRGRGPVLWDINNNREVRDFKKMPLGDGDTPFALSKDGKGVVALRSLFDPNRLSLDHFVTCWEVDTGKELWTRPVDLAIPSPLAFTPDSKTVLLGGGESFFTALDASTGKVMSQWGGHRGAVTQLVFEPKSGRFWTASMDKTVKRWAPDSRAELFTLKGHDDIVTGLAIVDDKLLTASNDKTLKLWPLGSDKMSRQMTGHTGGITSLAVSANGKLALTGSSDRSLKLWNLGTGKDVKTMTGHADSVTAVAISADGKWAASGSADKTARVWYLPDDGKEVEPIVLEGHTREVTAVAFLPQGRLLSAGQDQTLRLWKIEDGKLLGTFTGHKNWITSLTVSPDGKLAITTSDDLTMKLWDVAAGKEIASVDIGTAGDVAKCTSLTPDGRAVLAGTANWLILRFDLPGGK